MLSNIITSNDWGFLLGGTSLSGLSGDKTDVGTQYQYCWIVKASVCNPNNITSSQNQPSQPQAVQVQSLGVMVLLGILLQSAQVLLLLILLLVRLMVV